MGLGNLAVGDDTAWSLIAIDLLVLALSVKTEGIPLIIYFVWCTYDGYQFLRKRIRTPGRNPIPECEEQISRRSMPSANTTAWGWFKNVLTLGGDGRVRVAHTRFLDTQSRYEKICFSIEDSNDWRRGIVSRLRAKVANTKRELRLAQKILFPWCMYHPRLWTRSGKSHVSRSTNLGEAKVSPRSSIPGLDKFGSETPILPGIGAGTAATILAWQGVQVFGTASTGTAIGSIHGIAASNAGWAKFGGGSLAAGGGGMALGHLVLPSIGVIVAVGVSSVRAHRKADEINRATDHLEGINNQNQAILTKLQNENESLKCAEDNYDEADHKLSQAIRDAVRMLFPLKWLSSLHKYLRFLLTNVYYTTEEQSIVDGLDKAISDFMESFGPEAKPTQGRMRQVHSLLPGAPHLAFEMWEFLFQASPPAELRGPRFVAPAWHLTPHP